jgi:phospholipase/carboxylesterase
MLEHITINPLLPAKKAVIWLHGLGADGHNFASVPSMLNLQETRFIFPHAPIRPVTLNGGYPMRAWFDIFGLDRNSDIDSEGIAQAESQIAELIHHQASQGIAYDNIYLAGFSQGGVLAVYTTLRFEKKLAGAIGLSTFLPRAESIDRHPANASTPFFIGHGTTDNIVLFHYGRQLADWLSQTNYPVSWHEYPMAHEVCQAEMNDLAVWFQR